MFYKRTFLVIVLCLLFFNLFLISLNSNKSSAKLCAQQAVPTYYTGVFVKRSGQDYIAAHKDITSFNHEDQSQRNKGFGLVDIDPIGELLPARTILWAGVWHSGQDQNSWGVNLTPESLKNTVTVADKVGRSLIDLAPYEDNSGKIWWAGVWSPTGKHSVYKIDMDWKSLNNLANNLKKSGYDIIDIEAYYDNGPKWAGVWQQTGFGFNFFYTPRVWNDFVNLANQNHEKGRLLVDVNAYVQDTQLGRLWTGIWIGGSNGNFVTAGKNWDHFVNTRNDFNKNGYLLVDMEPYNPVLKGEIGYCQDQP